MRLAGRRWTQNGALLVFVQDTRQQSRNREIARERLVELIANALEKPKRRVSAKLTYGSVKRRLKTKKARGEVNSFGGPSTRTELPHRENTRCRKATSRAWCPVRRQAKPSHSV